MTVDDETLLWLIEELQYQSKTETIIRCIPKIVECLKELQEYRKTV